MGFCRIGKMWLDGGVVSGAGANTRTKEDDDGRDWVIESRTENPSCAKPRPN